MPHDKSRDLLGRCQKDFHPGWRILPVAEHSTVLTNHRRPFDGQYGYDERATGALDRMIDPHLQPIDDDRLERGRHLVALVRLAVFDGQAGQRIRRRRVR